MTAALVFLATYLVISIQRLPGVRLDRPSGALLGAVATVGLGILTFDQALRAIDLETIAFLLGMMIVLAYLQLSGFFELVERRVLGLARSGRSLLAFVVASSGILAALFMNDTVCLMLTPVVVRVTRRLGLPPVPFLIALATAANIGSAATIVGNPQDALIAVRSGIGLLPFTARLWPVAALGLLVDFLLLGWLYRGSVTPAPLVVPPPRVPVVPERWLVAAGLGAGAVMMAAMAAGVRPAAASLIGAALVLAAGSRRPRRALQEVDWALLLFFAALFVVMRGFESAGLAEALVHGIAGPLAAGGARATARLGAAVALLSQATSNVPAVLLFLPALEALPRAAAEPLWLALAAFSTLAGNLTVIGSVANVIVFETARRDGIEVGFLEYLRAGLPITLLTCAIAFAFLALG